MTTRLVWLIVLCLVCSQGFAQRLEEDISPQAKALVNGGKRTAMAKLQNPMDAFSDSLRQVSAGNFPYAFTDSLGQVFHAVPSRKWLNHLPDSLQRFSDLQESLPTITEEALVEHIRSEFYEKEAAVHDSVDSALKPQQALLEKPMPEVPQFQNPTTFIPSSLVPLSANTILSRASTKILPSGRLVPGNALELVDSLRARKLRRQHLALDSLSINKNATLLRFREREAFWKKTYYELVLGASSINFQTFQVAPALGLPLGKGVSLGLGPSLQFQQTKIKENQTRYDLQWSVRGFVKTQFLHDRAYGQVEDLWLPPGGHTLLAGGGYLLALSSRTSLNIGIFYKIYTQPVLPQADPFVIRLGLSALQQKTTRQ